MKKILLLLIVTVFFLPLKSIKAQVLLTEDFTQTAGTQINGVNGWTAHSGTGTNPITVTSPGLTYTGYIGSGVGNAVSLTYSGEDDNKLLPAPVTSGTVYASVLVNCSAAQASGDYFFHMGTGTTTFCAKLFIKSSGSGFAFGISRSASYNSTILPVFTTQTYSFNTTYLVVIKYTFVSGTTNDQVDLFVFSTPALPSVEPASTLTTTDAGSAVADVSNISAIFLRQGTSSVAPTVQVDGIRAGLTWSDVLPVAAVPVATTATNVSSTGFTANWNTFSSAIDYWFDVSTVSDFSTLLADYNNKEVGNVTSYVLTSLTPNTTYYYRVRASDGTTTSSNSNTISVGTLVTTPVAKNASGISATGFIANWDASTGATDYWMDVSTTLDFSIPVTGYSNKEVGNNTSFGVTSLSAGQTYYFRIRASNANGISENSNIITVVTSAMEIPVAAAPTNISTTGFTANWSYSQPVITYLLDVSTNPDFSTFVTGYNSKDVGAVTNYTVASLNPSTVYYYRVYASTAAGLTPTSNVMPVTTLLAAPVAIAATNITATGFKANWNATAGANNYWLDVSLVSDFSTLVAGYDNKLVGNITSYNVTSLTAGKTYYYRISSSNNLGTSDYSNTITVATPVVGITDDASVIPTSYNLFQNYPNPFNPSTIIKYQIPESGLVTLKVYNMLGDEICTLINETKSAGVHSVKFDASTLTSGIYVYKIQAGNYLQIKKMILVK